MIRATLVLLIAHLVIPRLRRRSAAERHLLWTVTLATAATLPLLGLVLPAWQAEWARGVVDAWPSLIAVAPWAASQSPEVIVRATGVEPAAWTLAQSAMVLWIAGTSVALLVLARDVARLVPLARAARPLTNDACRAICEELARVLHLSRVPALLVSSRAVMPMTWGIRHPRVLLPASASTWPRERLQAVLAHELGHIGRADWPVHLLAQLACAIYWFHPLFWSAERALGRESEQAADDAALGVGLDASQYAAHLIEIVRATRVTASSRAAAVAMARTAHLERRVAALLHPRASRSAVTRRAAIVTTALSIAIGLPLAAMTADRPIDVDIRAADLPVALRTSSAAGPEPMLPAVRRARGAGGAAFGGGAALGGGAESVSLPEIAEYTTPPLYSDEARRRGVEGVVTIAVQVDEKGRLTLARVLQGLGSGLDQNALVALRQWRFRPGTRGGVPAAMDAEVDIEFNLRSEGVNELIANDMATLVGPGVTPPRVVRTSRLPVNVAKAHGSVILDVVLLQDGSPKIVRILQSLTPEADENAVRHFEQWRFTPATKNGVPVKVRMNAEVRFHG